MQRKQAQFPRVWLVCYILYSYYKEITLIHISFEEKTFWEWILDLFNLSFKSHQSHQFGNTEHLPWRNGACLTSNANWHVHRLRAGSVVACPPPAESLMLREAIRLQAPGPGEAGSSCMFVVIYRFSPAKAVSLHLAARCSPGPFFTPSTLQLSKHGSRARSSSRRALLPLHVCVRCGEMWSCREASGISAIFLLATSTGTIFQRIYGELPALLDKQSHVSMSNSLASLAPRGGLQLFS